MKRWFFNVVASAVAVLPLLSGSVSAADSLVDFNGIGPVGEAPPNILVGGVTLSFTNLEISEIGEASNGFGGRLPGGSTVYNDVIAADQDHFNGQFLTALGYARAVNRPLGFTRTIEFDAPVTDVSLYVADIDTGEGITANAIDEDGNVVSSLAFLASLNLDLQVQLVDFGAVSGIRKITLVGNDPVGIDNLSFSTDFAELLMDLDDHVAELGLPQGLEGSLQAKIAAAFAALSDANPENDVAASNVLQAFINAVRAQSDKKISVDDADALIAEAQAIIDLLNS